jgi:segregation and condensation protein B
MRRRACSANSLSARLAGSGRGHAVAAVCHPLAKPARPRPRLVSIGAGSVETGRDDPIPPGAHVRSDEMARLEATLFLSREPLTVRRLAKLARLSDGTRARVLLRELRRLQEASGAAIRVEQIAGGYQLFTRAPFGPWIRRLLDASPSSRLSAAATETLAIVAYRQPVTRAEIEAIRGVGSEEMLRQLLERDLVAIGGRAEDLGRPNVYVTTRRFLATFGLARIEDLPPVAEFSDTAAGLPDEGEEDAEDAAPA